MELFIVAGLAPTSSVLSMFWMLFPKAEKGLTPDHPSVTCPSGHADMGAFCDDYARSLPITDPLLQQKALHFAKLLGHSDASCGAGSPDGFHSRPTIVCLLNQLPSARFLRVNRCEPRVTSGLRTAEAGAIKGGRHLAEVRPGRSRRHCGKHRKR